MVFAAFAVVVLLMAKACGGDGPDLSKTVVQREVPLVSTFTPTPRATPVPTEAPAGDPGVADDPNNPYEPGGTPADPCSDPNVAEMVGEDGQPLCDETVTPATASPTAGATASPTASPTVKPTKTAKPTATPSASATPTSDSEAAGPNSCAKSDLEVKLKTDQRVYSGSQKPKLYLGVQNTGDVACLVDMGSKALSITIISGKDRIWSSDDCQGKGTSDVRLLKPGQTLWARSVWSKVRSKPGCPKGMPTAKPGTYVVEGSAGGVKARKRAVIDIK
ncbi:hypothetical protein GCM10009547_26120 [Sporichthya brevicatena]|uniref:Uncharacterized protein n=2 Tax=Sporichthya brevicatena TaxID=171442 RepID=A0ABP3S3P0_9ACTN